MNNKLKKLLYVIIAVTIICVLFYFIPIGVKVDMTLEGIRWNESNAELSEKTNVTINGKLRKFWGRNDKFIGTIAIDGKEVQNYTRTNPAVFRDAGNASKHYQWSSPAYYSEEKNTMIFGGYIWIDASFNKMCIETIDEYYSFPADSREDAVELNDLMTTW